MSFDNPFGPDRHPSTQHFGALFDYEHLPVGPLRLTSYSCYELAVRMVDSLPDGQELTAGLRKLLEAKDCFVRASLLFEKSRDEKE